MSLNVSSRSYYDWRLNKYTIKINKREELTMKIQESFDNSQKTYGSVRIAADLRANGTNISRSTVQRYMKELGIRSSRTPKFRVCTTNSNHNNIVADNLLDRNFSVNEPNKVWVSDITYIKTKSGFDYQTTIIDLFDRKVVGWSQSNDMTTKNTTIAAFNSAIKRRNISTTSTNKLMLHSDRGSQYTCNEFVKQLNKYGVVRNNSRKGNCWDNAVAESFFKTLKVELIYTMRIKTVEETRNRVFAYIETWYNKRRRNKALNNLSIDEFWDKYYKEINMNKAA